MGVSIAELCFLIWSYNQTLSLPLTWEAVHFKQKKRPPLDPSSNVKSKPLQAPSSQCPELVPTRARDEKKVLVWKNPWTPFTSGGHTVLTHITGKVRSLNDYWVAEDSRLITLHKSLDFCQCFQAGIIFVYKMSVESCISPFIRVSWRPSSSFPYSGGSRLREIGSSDLLSWYHPKITHATKTRQWKVP